MNNTYNVSDDNFLNSDIYKSFIDKNRGVGSLKIRAYSAREAIPIGGVIISVSTMYDDDKIVFFEGVTNESGIIDKIELPAPELNENNLEAPTKTVYEVEAIYDKDNIDNKYKVNMYDGICVVQSISLLPNMDEGGM